MLIVTGYMHVGPADLAVFASELKELAAAARKRSGNLSFAAAVDDPVAGRLLITERWADQAALTAHLQADDTVAFLDRWRTRIGGEILKYDAAGERGLMD